MRKLPALITTAVVGASLLFAVGSPAYAASTYYVDARPGGGGDGSAGDPWRTLSQVSQANLAPGDTVLFARGDSWTGELLIDDAGQPGAPITVSGYGDGGAAAPRFSNPGPFNAIRVTGSYIVLDGVLVSDADYGYSELFDVGSVRGPQDSGGAVLLDRGSHHNVVRNSEMTDVGIGVKLFGSDNVVTSNYIYDLRMSFQGFNFMFNNTSYGAIGVSVKGPRNEISYNTFVNCLAPSNAYVIDGGAIEVEGINEPARNNVGTNIHHNRSTGSAGFLENDADNSFVESTVSYNVSDDYQSFMLLFNQADVDIVNNTVIRQLNYGGPSTDKVFQLPGDVSQIQLLNNIFVVRDGLTVLEGGNIPRHENNVYWSTPSGGNPAGTGLGNGEVSANPLLVDLAGKDFHLQTGSPAVDAGVSFGFSSDFDGNPVPVGNAPDMGAYERQGGGPTGGTGSNLISDGGFESQPGASLASPWTPSGGGSVGVDYQAQKARSGANNAWVSTSAAGWSAINQGVTLLPNTNYVLRGFVRSSGNFDQRGYFGIAGTGFKTEASFGSTGSYTDGYQQLTVPFNSGPGGAAGVFLGIDGGSSAGSWVQLDDVSLT